MQIVLFIAGWYICSGVTLFGNKHMLSTLHANPDLLALSQMVITATMGATKVYGSYLVNGCDERKIPVTPYVCGLRMCCVVLLTLCLVRARA